MDSEIAYCVKHKLSVAQCNCKEMRYKQPCRVPKNIKEISEEDLLKIWIAARTLELHKFKTALLKIMGYD